MSDGIAAADSVDPTPRASPLVRALRALPRTTFAAAVFVLVALALLALVLLNPGERVGPVEPATPPVGQELPAG